MPNNAISNLLGQLGPLRAGLAVLALLIALFAPLADVHVDLSGWRILPTLLVPALAPLVFMVLMLDALMSRVWMADAEGPQRAHYRRLMLIDLLLGLVLLGAWLPFFMSL